MKKIVIIFNILLFSFMLGVNVYAKTCNYGIPSPSIYYNGSWTYDAVLNFTTSASSCLAKNITVLFSDGDYVFNSGGIYLEGILMEKDADSNPDDPVKRYTAVNYSGKGLEWSQKVETLDYGNLDSAGDQTCELYMKFRLKDAIAQNNVEYFEPGWFRYTICVE